MTQERTTPYQPPKFCSQDGMELEDATTEIKSGFDIWTGRELPSRQHVTRRCPNHPNEVWVRADSGDWVRP